MMGDQITFIVTSVIYFPDKKLSYSVVRSHYSPQERAEQTLKTIQSIRKMVPGATIILVEMGKQKNIGKSLIRSADQYLYTGGNLLVGWARNSIHKGFGEAIGLLAAVRNLNLPAGTCFKISGRYFLTDGFNIEDWKGDYFFFKKYGNSVSTRLYGFDAALYPVWIKAMQQSLYKLYKGRQIEDVLPLYIPGDLIKEIKTIGVSGFVGPNGKYLSE